MSHSSSYEIDDSDSEDEEDELDNSLESSRMTQMKRQHINKNKDSQNPFAFAAAAAAASKSSSNNDSNMSGLAASAARGVNSSMELLRRLQSVDEPTAPTALPVSSSPSKKRGSAEEELLLATLAEVRAIKENILREIPQRHRVRLLPQEVPHPLTEYPLLFGRMFNLSLNLKILSHAQCLDAVLAERILSDLVIVEVSLEDKRARVRGRKGGSKSVQVVGKMMSGLKLAANKKVAGRPKLSLKM